jgi:hypothetical protein
VAAACVAGGHADVVMYSPRAGPGPADAKAQRQAWVFLAGPDGLDPPPPPAAATTGEHAEWIDVVASAAVFPELFSASAPDGCGMCAAARRGVQERCAAFGGGLPGLAAGDAHVLIMSPQNGHHYGPDRLILVFRASGFPLAPGDGRAAVVRASRPLHRGLELVLAGGHPRWTPPGGGWDEYAVPMAGLEPGLWEVRVALLDVARRTLSADLILFNVDP